MRFIRRIEDNTKTESPYGTQTESGNKLNRRRAITLISTRIKNIVRQVFKARSTRRRRKRRPRKRRLEDVSSAVVKREMKWDYA